MEKCLKVKAKAEGKKSTVARLGKEGRELLVSCVIDLGTFSSLGIRVGLAD